MGDTGGWTSGGHRWPQGTWVAWPDPTLLSQMHQLQGTVTGTGTWPMVSNTPSVPLGHPLGGTLGTREGRGRDSGSRRDPWDGRGIPAVGGPQGPGGTPGIGERDPKDRGGTLGMGGDPRDQEGTPRDRRGTPGMGEGSQRPGGTPGTGEGPGVRGPQGQRGTLGWRDPRDQEGNPGVREGCQVTGGTLGGARAGAGPPTCMVS